MTRDGASIDDELAHTATAEDPTAAASAAAMEARRSVLGHYRLEHRLGEGGMGVVHAAFDTDLERRVAIKLLHAGPSDANRARLLREARAMARLDHPNVVTIFDVDSIEGKDLVVMELVEGTTLAEWLRAEPRPRAAILDAFQGAGRGLAAAHAAGMVHRDFKPHNVLRAGDGRCKVTDFGLARDAETQIEVADLPASASSSNTPTPLVNLTVSGAIVGTPAYMAPEQWASGTLGPAVDQFAFCVALWEALAGQRPFRGDTREALRAAIEGGPGSLDPAPIPRRLRPVLLRGLAVDPARRWPSMAALLEALSSRRRTATWIAAGLAAVALATGAIVAMQSSSPASTRSPPDEVPSVTVPKRRAELIASIRKVDDTHYVVPRPTVDQLLTERTELEQGARPVAARDNDTVIGFKLFSVRPGSAYAALGLRDFDIVRAVDNIPLTSTEQIAAAYKHARVATAVVLDVDRRGTPLQIAITVTP